MNVLVTLELEQGKLLLQIEELEHKYQALQQAIDVLTGTYSGTEVRKDPEARSSVVVPVEVEPRAVPAVDVRPQRPTIATDSRLLCAGCGGRLEPASRELSNGKWVNYLMCMDSSCNNEVFA